MSQTRQKNVYHAVRRGLAASPPEISARLCGLKWACHVESQKNGGFLARIESDQQDQRVLSRCGCRLLLCSLKGCHRVGYVLKPHRVDDSYPHICQGAQGHTVALAFCSLAFVIRQRPGFLFGRLPGKLIQGVAQRLQTGIALMRLGIIAALKRNGSSPGQSLHTHTCSVAATIIAPFSQQSRGEAFSRSWKTAENLAVFMGQKKGGNLLVVAGDLFNQRQELSYQRQHQSRFGSCDNRISMQLGLMQPLTNLGAKFVGIGVPSTFEHARNFLDRSSQRRIKRRIGLQENQARPLLQLVLSTCS